MMNEYKESIMAWLNSLKPDFINDKNFLLLMGSLFLLGLTSKWIVVMNYERLIKKAEHMTAPENKTLKQIKMKYDSIKQINGQVANPMLLVKRHINRCRAGIISLNKMNKVINLCTILCICLGGLVGLALYYLDTSEMVIIAYIATGCFFGFTLEMINRSVGVSELQMELTYVIVDYLENGPVERKIDSVDVQEKKEVNDMTNDEAILNQVIGEFLQ